ncbi:alpha-glucosidase [Spirochaeta isovalerica]|uniref:Oligo-1,6-glucosidase/alpha-glucosidase n=1 Tax=Spirochaeta isovalerica TaxID=150 RepID=A0A841RDT3_9SPIO|nr:alpha-glucosidase [Spirochaeta isovalerica]MBB6480532.1 oligo-1,6-glucosidase/alpha-glucosidase [Spirochaeta isovalerica]
MKNGTDSPWWKETTVYQIYPRSFQDSNGDGIGDLPGIISRLDYIKALGFETIWISPFFASPQKDFGYDISDYKAIAPEYGTMEDCDRLIDEVHRRGMKILFDMVLNHTSDEHPWFIESASSKDNPKRDWYVWHDGKGPGKPPNNWLSQVGGSGWHFSKQTGQWFWAAFLPFQPDLNYRNHEVKETMFNILRFWLDKGVDGFRLDIIGAIYEDEQFRDNPFSFRLLPGPESGDKFFRSVEMIENLPETIEFARELRSVLDEYEGRFLIGETFGSLKALRDFTGREKPDGLHSTFLFKTMMTPLKASALRKLIREQEETFPEPWIPTWVYANHDSMRCISRYKGNERLLRLQVLLQHTARGIPVTYQGEEIAMKQSPIGHKDALDPVARAYRWMPGFLFNFFNRMTRGAMNRDGCRTPMQWDSGPNSGFSPPGCETWLPVNEDYRICNRDLQQNDSESLLGFYRRLLSLRRGEEGLRSGALILPQQENGSALLVYDRIGKEKKFRMYMNFSPDPQTLSGVEREIPILSTEFSKTGNCNLTLLSPYEGRIYIVEKHGI